MMQLMSEEFIMSRPATEIETGTNYVQAGKYADLENACVIG